MAAPLTKGQKAYLAQKADQAYRRLAAIARGQGEEWDMSTAAISKWRHDQVAIACGKYGLRCCSQDDYAAVKAHFLHLLGEDDKALNAHVHGQGNERRQWEHKILEILKDLGRGMPYAEAICRRNCHGTTLMDASVDQLKKVFFSLNNQRRRERKSEAA